MEEMTRLGYHEDETIRFLYAGILREPEEMVEWIEALPEGTPDAFVCIVDASVDAVREARPDDTTPVLFWMVSDPVAAGLVGSPRSPSGRFSGVTTVFEGSLSEGRRLEYLQRIDPEIKRVLVPHNPGDTAVQQSMRTIRSAAAELEIELVEQSIRSPTEAQQLLQVFPSGIDAIFLLPDRVLGTIRKPLAEVAIERGIIYSGPVENSVNDGALMAYSFSEESIGRKLAGMARQIDKGTNVGDIPLETPEFVLALNLAVADRIDMEIPLEVLQQATTIVRQWP